MKRNWLKIIPKKKSGQSILRTWMMIFAVFVMIALVQMGIYFYTVNNILAKNLHSYNRVKLSHTKEKIDQAIIDLAYTADSVAADEMIRGSILRINNGNSLEDRQAIIRSFAIKRENNRMLSDVVLMLPEEDLVISAANAVYERYYYSANFDGQALSREEWLKLFAGAAESQYHTLAVKDIGGRTERKLVYRRALDGVNASVMVILDSANLSFIDPYFYKILMIDGENLPLATGNKNEPAVRFNFEEMTEQQDYRLNEDSYVSYTKSILPELKYVLFTDKDIFLNDLERTQMLTVFLMGLYLVVGVLLTWLFSQKQYGPIKGILKILKYNTNEKEKNEYRKISSSISEMLAKNLTFSREMRKKDYYIQERAVVNLLKGRSANLPSENRIEIAGRFLSVVRLTWSAGESNPLFGEDDLIFFALKNVSEEIFSLLGKAYSAEVEGAIVLIISFDGAEGIREQLFAAAEKLKASLKDYLDMRAEIMLGRIVEKLSDIPDCYEEVLDASSVLDAGTEEIVWACEIMERNRPDYSYSLQMELEIIEYVKNGDYDGAYKAISKEIDAVLYEKKFPVYLIRCFMVDLESTILKALVEVERSNGIRMQEKLLNIGELFRSHSISTMQENVCKSLKEVCDFVIRTHSKCGSELCGEIRQYIKVNFSDVELNVTRVSEQFHLNPTYLSSMFKKNTGIRLLEYINMVRIEEAKKIMLKCPALSMEIVAEMTGFANARTFRRVFYKYEATHPTGFVKNRTT